MTDASPTSALARGGDALVVALLGLAVTVGRGSWPGAALVVAGGLLAFAAAQRRSWLAVAGHWLGTSALVNGALLDFPDDVRRWGLVAPVGLLLYALQLRPAREPRPLPARRRVQEHEVARSSRRPAGRRSEVRARSWSVARYRRRPNRVYAALAGLCLTGVCLAGVALVHGRLLGALACVVGVALFVAALGLRGPFGVLPGIAGTVVVFQAGLFGRFADLAGILIVVTSVLVVLDLYGRRDDEPR
ncbi:hypothetical protein ABFT23_03650 [Nocardioides sp. C4-1]|uniref:hypothetical protein n=1 Tax=Nocardioides sp. C4-1 TaxID=3151851 RepID=UPI003265EE3C